MPSCSSRFPLNCYALFPLRFGLLFLGLVAGLSGAQPRVLTTAREVRALSVAEAESGPQAHLRGVVVFVEATAIFVQDETSTTFFRPTEDQMHIRPGDVVEIQGPARMGLYLPGLGTVEARVVDRVPLPPAIPVGFDDIVTARYHYQRVAIEGIVRSVSEVARERTLVRLAIGSRLLDVRLELPPPTDRSLVDSRVRVTGLAAGFTNDRRQLVQTYVRVQTWDDIAVLEPPTPVAKVPRISATELLAFRPTGPSERRIAISGVVTAVFPDGHLYLRDEATSFAARLTRAAPVLVGDRVELLGFPEMAGFAASVVDAELLQRSAGPPPVPFDAGRPDTLDGTHHARLVTLTARLADSFKSPQGVVLVLPDKDRTLQAEVLGADSAPAAGSVLRITGICQIEPLPGGAFASVVGAVSLRVRSTDDVEIVRAPPWWTPARLATGLAVFAGVTLLAGLWIAALRRQVRRQTAALRERIVSEAALEERQRIAREFHDSLEQDLTGLGLRLDAAATRAFDEKGRQIVDVSRSLLAHIQAETKNIVADLRDSAGSESDLATALEHVAATHDRQHGVAVRADVRTAPPPLPGGSVHHLRMIARESVTNALKHARASQIVITLDRAGDDLVLRISDDGSGFDAAANTVGRSGHFGCVGIRERARKLGARVAWHTAPGGGTSVEIALPLCHPAARPGAPVPALAERPATAAETRS